MKRALPLLIVFLLACSSLIAATARENERLKQGKITKNEAQHLVMKKYPGATIKSCVLTNGKDHGIWLVKFTKAGSHDLTKVQVDGLTGQILP